MYRAIKPIGGYGVGDIVPNSQAILWLEIYDIPHVEEVTKESKNDIKKPIKKINRLNKALESYLKGNQIEVRKNIFEELLNKYQLKSLLDLEISGKNRPLIVQAINKKLK